MAAEVKYTIRADDKTREGVTSARNNTADLGGEVKKLGSEFVNMQGIVGKLAGGFTIANLAVNATKKAFELFKQTISESIQEYSDAEKVTAKLSAVLDATGKSAYITLGEIANLGSQFQQTTIYGDDLVRNAAAIALTFDTVSSDSLPRLMSVAADMATVFETDLVGSMRQLGMALDDPEQGMQRLRRAGVMLDAQSQALVKSLVEQGKTTEAQGVLLDALEGKVKGAAEAMKNTASGAAADLKNALSDLKESMGASMAPAFKTFNEGMAEAVRLMQEWIDKANAARELGYIMPGVDIRALNAGATALSPGGTIESWAAKNKPGFLSSTQGGGLTKTPEQLQREALNQAIDTFRRQVSAGLWGAQVTDIEAPGYFAEEVRSATEAVQEMAFGASYVLRHVFRGDIVESGKALGSALKSATAAIGFGGFAGGGGGPIAPPDMTFTTPYGSASWMFGDFIPDYEAPGREVAETMVSVVYGSMVDYAEMQASGYAASMLDAMFNAIGTQSVVGNYYPGAVVPDMGDMEMQSAVSGQSDVTLGILISRIKPLIDGISSFAGAIGQAMASAASMKMILDPLTTIFTAMMNILGPIIDAVLTPIVGILVILGETIGKILAPVIVALSPIIKKIGEVFVWLYNEIIVPVGNWLSTAFQEIANGIKQAINSVIEWINRVFKKSIGLLDISEVDRSVLDEISYGELEAAGTGAIGTPSYGFGAGASYSTPKIINIYEGGSMITVNTDVIAGDGGMDELVILLRDRLARLESLGY